MPISAMALSGHLGGHFTSGFGRAPDGYNGRGPLRGRLMVGRSALDREVGVRIPAPQPRYREHAGDGSATAFLLTATTQPDGWPLGDRSRRARPRGPARPFPSPEP